MTKPYTAVDIADMLGLSVETFYRRRETLHAKDGLPLPLMSSRPYRWDRATVDAWRGRHNPHSPKYPAANDSAPVSVPASDDDQRAFLQQHYGSRH